MENRRIVLVTGLSGAGKTSSMAVLEDMGYHCIDGFPAFLADTLVEEIDKNIHIEYNQIAISVSANDFNTFYHKLKNTDTELLVLFLDASKEQLLLRYKYSRRNHPLVVKGLANSLEEAIDVEIKEFASIKSNVSIIIDTSHLTNQMLTSRIQRFFGIEGKNSLTLSFISFGYRNGLPMDADYVFDVRFLNNPYWDETLRSKTGNDAAVFSYVIDDPKTQVFLEKLQLFLNYAINENLEASKHLLTIAIGCTGGQHRSVSVTNWLYDFYRKEYTAIKDHRDIKEGPEL